MKAFIQYKYGGPEVLILEEVDRPKPQDDEILVKTKAISVNPADWHMMRASPFFIRIVSGLFKPKNKIIGADFSGIVAEVGSKISDYKVGDEVFGDASTGTFSEFVTVCTSKLAIKPQNASFEESACLGIAGLTALQGLRDHGKLQAGERVLINGSSGGVGHYCVQIANSMGAHVTAVCSSKNEAFVRELGAEEVIDYTATDIHSYAAEFDLVLDVHGNLTYADFKRFTGKNGRGIMIGFTGMGNMLKVMLKAMISKTNIKSFTAQAKHEDLVTLSEMYSDGIIRTHIAKIYPFEELPDAISFIEKMHTRGKIALTIA